MVALSTPELDFTGEIVGRASELAVLGQFVADVRAGPASFLMEGEPGIGKTTLWAAAVAAARQTSCSVLACRPAGSEVQLAYAALGDLLEGVLADALPALPEPQRRALEVALLLEDSRGPPPQQRAIAVAVLSVIRVLAGVRPVVVAIDDLQWLDRPTAAVLEFALRRLRREPVGLLAARRVEPGTNTGGRLAEVFPEGTRSRLRVAPLSVGALHRLIRARLGFALSRSVLLRVHDVSGGNPFYGLELARALRQTEGRMATGERLPLTPPLQEVVKRRLGELPASVQDVLLAAAALSAPTLRAVQAVTAAGRARSRIATAVGAGVLELDGERIRFTHPLLAAAIYSASDPMRRRRLHRRLAASIKDEEERARHLALGTARASAPVAAVLDRAALHASARGAPHAAAELYELASSLTPAGAAADLRRRKVQAADAHVESGEFGRARFLLDAVIDELAPGDERAGVLLRAARAARNLRAQGELAGRARQEATDDRIVASAHLLLGGTWPDRGMADALRHGRLALVHAEGAGDPRLVAQALTRLAHWELWAGQSTPGLLERALASKQKDDSLRGYEDPRMPLALRRMYQGRLDEARALFGELLSEAERLGDENGAVALLRRLVDVELRAGEWQRAEADAERAYERQDQIGLEHDGGFTVYLRALVAAYLGRVDDAQREAKLGVQLARSARSENMRVLNLGVLGFLELSRGNAVAAVGYLTPAIKWVDAKELGLAPLPVAPHAIDALLETAHLARARELTARFEREARALESAWAIAIAVRCRGIAAAADGDLTAGIIELERATATAAAGNWPFEHGRALLALGRTQRRARQKRAARNSLEEALRLFERLGARLWADQAHRELGKIGGRAPSRGRLTETEERVAALVAEGRSNREVAAALYVTERTVEGHLTRIYAKLGMRSRTELAHQIAAR